MTPEEALSQLRAMADSEKAAGSAAYHKAPREYLGISVPDLTAKAREWRSNTDLPERIRLADGLWQSDTHEARIAAAKLLTQARIRDDERVWRLFASWVPDFDAWAIADHACEVGSRRLVADPSRIDEVETWLRHENVWVRRAALVVTLPWTKQNHPKAPDLAIRDRVLGWAAGMAEDRNWFIQKAIAWWLRELSKHDPSRARTFLEDHAERLKPFARKEAGKYL